MHVHLSRRIVTITKTRNRYKTVIVRQSNPDLFRETLPPCANGQIDVKSLYKREPLNAS